MSDYRSNRLSGSDTIFDKSASAASSSGRVVGGPDRHSSYGPSLSNDDTNRPRRPNPETLRYLYSLPLHETDLQTNDEDVDDRDGDGDKDALSMAATNALEELYEHDLASLCCEERSSQILERLIRVSSNSGGTNSDSSTTATTMRRVLVGLQGYHAFLSRHRYGSHVVQTVLHGCLSCWNTTVDAEEDGSLPALHTLILNASQELLSEDLLDGMKHVCASHVLRSLMLLLGGMEEVSDGPGPAKKEFRGGHSNSKKKKKKKSKKKFIGGFEEDQVAPRRTTLKLVGAVPELQTPLWEVLDAIATHYRSSNSGDVTELICHPSSGPTLTLLLRILSQDCTPTTLTTTTPTAEAMVHRKLNTHPFSPLPSLPPRITSFLLTSVFSTDNPTQARATTYHLSGERYGSHFMERLLPMIPDVLYGEILPLGNYWGQSEEYVRDTIGNYVLQTVLSTLRTKEQAVQAMECLETLLKTKPELLMEKGKGGWGVLLRMVECARKWEIGEGIVEALPLAIGRMKLNQAATNENENDEGESSIIPATKVKPASWTECVHFLLCYQPPASEASTQYITLHPNGARILHHLLNCCHTSNHFQKRLVKAVLSYDTSDLIHMAKDGMGSVCILDALLLNARRATTAVTLLEQFLPDSEDTGYQSCPLATLATDRIGHHVLLKLYDALPDESAPSTNTNHRLRMVEQLSHSTSKLTGNAMGRKVSETVNLGEYTLNGESGWQEAQKKRNDNLNFLEDMINTKESKQILEEDSDTASAGKKDKKEKKKRKRKHKRKSDDADNKSTKKKKVLDTTASIMDVLTLNQ